MCMRERQRECEREIKKQKTYFILIKIRITILIYDQILINVGCQEAALSVPPGNIMRTLHHIYQGMKIRASGNSEQATSVLIRTQEPFMHFKSNFTEWQ